MDILDDLLGSTAFWVLGVGAVSMTILGSIVARKMGLEPFPLWQLLILIAGELGAAAFFALRE